MKVSIIVPIFNSEKYLTQCLDSIFSQTFTDYELILVNDGSTDSSLTICQDYAKKDNRIKIICKPNGGLSSARNCGIEESIGEYLSFIDSDDIVHSRFIEILYNACIDKNVDMAQCKMARFVDEYQEPLFNDVAVSAVDYSNYIVECAQDYYSDSVCDKLFKSEIFSLIRFPVGELYEDGKTICDIWLKTFRQACCDFVGYFYRITPNSILTSYDLKKDYEQIVVWEMRKSRFDKIHYVSHIQDMNKRILVYLFYLFCRAKKNNAVKSDILIVENKIKEYIRLDKENRFTSKKQKLMIVLYSISKNCFFYIYRFYTKRNGFQC